MQTKKKILSFILMSILLLSSINFYIASANEDEDKYQSNKIKLQATLTPPYVLGPGDQLTIIDRTLRDVFGQVEQYSVIISGDGYISIPLPDGKQENLLVAGLTLDEISNEVRSLFGRTLKNPLVFVQIARYRPINVYIGGEILKPGIYKVESGTTQEKGGSTVGINSFGLSITQAIQLAGGVKPRGDITAIILTRGTNSEKISINLKALLTGDDVTQDVNLQPGDAIFINPTDDLDNQAQAHVALLGKLAYQEVSVNIVGEVNGGGNFTLPNDATIFDAIGKAGGLTDVGSLKKITISRYDESGVYKSFKLNVNDLIKKGTYFEKISLRPNDTIELEVSKLRATGKFFRETGKILIPLVAGASVQNLGQFIVQDNFFNRLTRAGKSGSVLPNTSNSGGQVTIINSQRVINEEK